MVFGYGTDGLTIDATDNGTNFFSEFLNLDLDLDYRVLLFNLLPKVYRISLDNDNAQLIRKILYKYLNVIFRYLNARKTEELAQRYDKLQEVNFNSKTIVLQQILRDTFKSDGIYIENTRTTILQKYLFRKTEEVTSQNKVFVYRKSEQGEVYYEPTFIYRKQEVSGLTDFTVRVPTSLISGGVRIEQIRSVVNTYNAVGIEFEIITY